MFYILLSPNSPRLPSLNDADCTLGREIYREAR